MVPLWVTASCFLAKNKEAELKLTTFSSLLVFPGFPILLKPQQYSTFKCCLVGYSLIIPLLGNYLNHATARSAYINTKERDQKERKERSKEVGIKRHHVITPQGKAEDEIPEESGGESSWRTCMTKFSQENGVPRLRYKQSTCDLEKYGQRTHVIEA